MKIQTNANGSVLCPYCERAVRAPPAKLPAVMTCGARLGRGMGRCQTRFVLSRDAAGALVGELAPRSP